MKQPQPYSAKYRQFKSLSKKVNRLITSGKFAELSKELQEKLVQKLKTLYQQLQGVFSPRSLKRILASAAILLGFQVSSQAQMFAPPVKDTFGLQQEAYFRFPDLVDLDADGDYDLLSGEYDGAFKYYENLGSADSASFDNPKVNPFDLDTLYFLNFPNASDLDNDGDFDILSMEYYNSFQYYENIGDRENPDFLDGGTNPFNLTYLNTGTYNIPYYMPSMVDLDKDGDVDLAVGGEMNRIAYYENEGTPEYPDFAFPVAGKFNLPTENVMLTSLAFADFDFDGDYDMITGGYVYGYGGNFNGSVFRYYENIGTEKSPAFQQTQGMFATDSMEYVSAFGMSLADLDDDGDQDLIFGGAFYDTTNNYGYGSFYYMENLSDPTGLQNSQEISELEISPNPASDFIYVAFSNDIKRRPESLELVDVNGNKVLSQDYYDTNTRLDVRSLPAGNYFIIARRDGKAIGTRKVVIAK